MTAKSRTWAAGVVVMEASLCLGNTDSLQDRCRVVSQGGVLAVMWSRDMKSFTTCCVLTVSPIGSVHLIRVCDVMQLYNGGRQPPGLASLLHEPHPVIRVLLVLLRIPSGLQHLPDPELGTRGEQHLGLGLTARIRRDGLAAPVLDDVQEMQIVLRISDSTWGTATRGSQSASQDKVGWIKGECLPCARPARYFYDDFPRLNPQIQHYRMEPPSRPIAASCPPNEATNHPCTTLNKKSISESPSQLCSTKFVRSN